MFDSLRSKLLLALGLVVVGTVALMLFNSVSEESVTPEVTDTTEVLETPPVATEGSN